MTQPESTGVRSGGIRPRERSVLHFKIEFLESGYELRWNSISVQRRLRTKRVTRQQVCRQSVKIGAVHYNLTLTGHIGVPLVPGYWDVVAYLLGEYYKPT